MAEVGKGHFPPIASPPPRRVQSTDQVAGHQQFINSGDRGGNER
jgi:hypothetical protein